MRCAIVTGRYGGKQVKGWWAGLKEVGLKGGGSK
jgi:hypothetical protein